MTVIADNELDAVLYPHQRRLVAPIGEDQLERNGVLSNSTGFPAITFPGGFSASTASAPLGVPIGIELLGPDWSEPTLIRLAYAFEQAARIRRPRRVHRRCPEGLARSPPVLSAPVAKHQSVNFRSLLRDLFNRMKQHAAFVVKAERDGGLHARGSRDV